MTTLFQNPIMCFYAIQHQFKDKFMEIIKRYCNKCFIVALEKAKNTHKETNGEHLQCIFDMEETTYGNMNKALIKEFKLRGQAKDGLGRQYGKITKDKINDIELACIYTTKEGNVISNIEQEQIKEWYEKSYIKKRIFNIKNLLEYLDSFYYYQGDDEFYFSDMIEKIKEHIIEYHLDYKIELPRRNIFYDYIRYYLSTSEKVKEKLEIIKYYYRNYT
jgi:hypothetical protein